MSRYVLLPVCSGDHYFLLVAICDKTHPKIYCMESIGGYPYPPRMTNFIEALEFLQKGRCDDVKFSAHVIQVPRQPQGSNDCGMFILEFAKRIVMDPIQFETDAAKDSLVNWFTVSSLANRRSDLAQYIREQSVVQREEGGFLYEIYLDSPLQDPTTVRKQVVTENRNATLTLIGYVQRMFIVLVQCISNCLS